MPITYNPPTGLAGTPSGSPLGSCNDLSWSASSIVNPPALLLHFDGTNGQTTTVDSSGNGNTMTINATNCALATAIKKFGTASLGVTTHSPLFSGTCSTPYALGSPTLDIFATNAYTVECWFNIAANVATERFYLFDYGGQISGFAVVGLQAYLVGDGAGNFELIVDNASGIFASTAGQTINQTFALATGGWHHFAMVLNGGVFTVYLDGVALSTTQTFWIPAQYAPPTTTPHVNIGGAMNLNATLQGGNIDEFAVWNAAIYTANFTPPVAPYVTTPTYYDVYRNGVSVAIVSALTDHDCPPGGGSVSYTYTVAASDGTNDISLPSSAFVSGTLVGTVPNLLIDEAIFGGYFGGVLNLVEFVYMPNRAPFLEGAANLILNRYKQEPTDSRQRGVDYTYFMVPGELITAVVLNGINAQGVAQADTSPVVTPLVVSNIVIDPLGQKFAYTVSGGQDGVEYTIQFETTTTLQASNVEEIFSINILIEDSFP